MICSTFITTPQSYAQGWDIRLSDALGNPQVVSWPPHDTTYSPNTVIIKFKRSALRLENLCYTYDFGDNLTDNSKKSETQMGLLTYDQKIYLFSQRFTPHEVTSDSLLANAMQMRGIDTLRRLTSANPCKDTISISILGDTVECEDYLYFEASFSNDTSVLSTCLILTYSYPNSLYYIEPNFYGEPTGPNDFRYSVQTSFHPHLTDIESAWNFETGIPEIQIGIIDDGIQYDKCEFNRSNNIGLGYKVAYGFSYRSPYTLDEVKRWAWHGTNMASLAAARTNDRTSECFDGIAGVAGGWGEDSIGCELYALSVGKFHRDAPNRGWSLSNFISAIFESSSNNPITGYGKQVDILNCSWKFDYSQSLKEAVQYAFVNNVSVVASRANDADTNHIYKNPSLRQNYFSYENQKDGALQYPGCFEEHLVTCVGAAGERHPSEFNDYSYQKDRVRYSNFGRTLDFIVSTGERRWNPYNPVNDLNRAVLISEIADPINNVNIGFEQTDGTSASTAILSGIYGLLRSYAVNHGFFKDLEPEDYQGILKASAEDRQGNRGHNNHLEDFDIYSGWGHVNAGNAFRMLDDGYRVFKGSNSTSLGYGEWELHPLALGNPYYKIAFAKATEWNQDPYLGDSSRVRVRAVTGQILIPHTEIDLNSSIYTWGVSGRTKPTGWSLGNPQMQHGYSVILPGSFNNSEDDGGHLLTPGHNLIPGIIHHRGLGPNGEGYSKSGIIDVTTFQFALLDSNNNIIDLLPPTQDLGVNISIFAKALNPTSVAKGNSEEQHLVYPSIANTHITIQNKEIESTKKQVRIRSLLGEIVSNADIEPSQSITPIQMNVSNLPIGSYFVEVLSGNKIQSYKIMIVR